MSIKKKILIHIAAFALIIMLVFTLFSEKLAGDGLVTVTTVSSQKGSFYEDITFNGTVDYGVKTVVEAPFFLEIEEVLIPSGTLVKAGDIVARSKGYQAEKALLMMEASIQSMRAEVDKLSKEVSLVIDEANKRYAEIDLRLKKIALEEALLNYDTITRCFNDTYELIAPIEGKLTVQNLASDRQYAVGDVMYEIADAATLEAVFTCPASQEQYVNVDDKITVEVVVYKLGEALNWIRDNQALKLKVLEKKTEGGITTFKTDIKPGRNERIDSQQLTANMTRVADTFSRLLPHGCIQRDMGSSYIYVVNTERNLFSVNHYVQKLEINVLAANEYYTAVSGEMLTGFNIVHTADGPLKDGQRVRLAE